MAERAQTSPLGMLGNWLRSVSPVTLYLWLLALVIAPNVMLFGTSFLKSSGGRLVYEVTLANYADVMTSKTVWVLILRTLGTAFAAAILATLIAYPLALYVSRYLKKWKSVAVILVVVPLWISLLMRIFAWRVILGERGVLNSFLVTSGILDEPSDAFLYTRFAVILTLAYMAVPFVFISSFTAIERVPRSLVEAARDAGAGAVQSFFTVYWPLTRQGLLIGFALGFLLSVGDYITPSMVGGLNGTMLGMVIASQFGLAGNWPLGAAQAAVLMVLVGLILGFLAWATRTRGILQDVDAGAAIPVAAPRSLAGWIGRIGVNFAACLPYVFLYLPILIIMMFSFNDSKVQTLPLTGFTFRWYIDLMHDRGLLEALQRTLTVATVTVLISVAVGVIFSMVLTYRRVFGRNAMELGLALPVGIPGVVFGIALVILSGQIGLKPGIGRVILGHLSFVMPVVMMIVLNRMRRLDPSFIDASRDLGADPWQTFRHVLFPLIQSAVIGGALLGFTMSVDEVIVTLFLTGFEPTLPVYVWNQMRFGFTPSVNAIFSLIGAISLILIVLGLWVTERRQKY